MKEIITGEEYINIYEACDWSPKAFSIILKRLEYSDELIITDYLDLYGMPIQTLINIKEVKGYLNLWDTSIISLGNLENVNGYVNLRDTPIRSLGSLKTVGGSLDISNTQIDDFGDLMYVEQNLFLKNTPIAKKYSAEQIRNIVKGVKVIFFH